MLKVFEAFAGYGSQRMALKRCNIPHETWRFMDVSNEDFYKASQLVSNTSLYKQAGNSIVVSVLKAIFSNLFKEDVKNGTE